MPEHPQEHISCATSQACAQALLYFSEKKHLCFVPRGWQSSLWRSRELACALRALDGRRLLHPDPLGRECIVSEAGRRVSQPERRSVEWVAERKGGNGEENIGSSVGAWWYDSKWIVPIWFNIVLDQPKYTCSYFYKDTQLSQLVLSPNPSFPSTSEQHSSCHRWLNSKDVNDNTTPIEES